MSTIKAVFLDMEGTLFAKQRVSYPMGGESSHHSLWSRLMYELGEGALAEDAQTIAKWERGEYTSYMDWVHESVHLMRRHGLDRTLFEAVLGSVDYNPGVRETLAVLHQRGLRTAIVSGGFMAQARRAQIDTGIRYAYAAVDLFWDGEGRPFHWNVFPSDFEGKVDYVNMMIRELGLEPGECAFVGDGRNDVHIARRVGLSFALEGHPELRAVSTHSIAQFSEILHHIS